jgi:hypothetical protein
MNFTTIQAGLEMMAVSEGGNIFIARDGRPTYKLASDADRPPDPALRVAIDATRFRDAVFQMNEQVVYNAVTVTDYAGVPRVVVTDEASIQAHWQKVLQLDTALVETADIQDRADGILVNYAQPRKFIALLDLSNVVTDWLTILSADLWSKLTLEVPLPNGDVVTQVSLVEGIEITTGHHLDWGLRWWLSVPPFRNLLATTPENVNFEGGSPVVGDIGDWTAESACDLSSVATEYNLYHKRLGQVYETTIPINPPQGSYALWADPNPAVAGELSVLGPVIAAEARQSFQARAFVRLVKFVGPTHIPSTVASRSVGLEFDWFDSTMVYLSTTVGVAVAEGISSWVQPEVQGRAPNGAAFVQLRVRAQGDYLAGQYVDNVRITRVV